MTNPSLIPNNYEALLYVAKKFNIHIVDVILVKEHLGTNVRAKIYAEIERLIKEEDVPTTLS